jgi:putative NADH-flavin reductase
MFGIFLRPAYEDHVSQENHVKQSRLDWIIVRPAAFTNGKRTGKVRHGFAATDKTTKLKISRADVADFMLTQLTDDTYLHKTPGLSY